MKRLVSVVDANADMGEHARNTPPFNDGNSGEGEHIERTGTGATDKPQVELSPSGIALSHGYAVATASCACVAGSCAKRHRRN